MEKSRKILLSLSCLILLIIFTACSGGQCDHVFGSWQMINEATCIDYGLEERTCNECGQIDSREISPTNNHDYQFSYEEKGDCNNAGRTVFSCKYCGLEKEEKGEKSEHQYQERIVMDPNCSNEGIKLFECQNCGYSYEERIEKTSHNYVLNHINNSTCYEEGYELYQCNTCGHSYENKLEKLSHDFQYSCTFEPSCGSDGYDEYRCSNCGDVEYRNEVPSTEKHTLQHISGDVKCGESGYINYVCQYCSYTEERYEQSPYTNHNFVDGVCTNCNSLIYKYEIVDGYAQLVDIYDKDIEELVVPYDDGNGRRVMSIDQIDWSKFKNLKRIKFNNAINFYRSNFSGMDSLEEVHIWDLNSWVTSEMFTYPYNNPLSNGAKLYVNGEQLTSVDLKEFDYVRSYAFAGLIAENLDYNKTELVSNTAFDGATFDLVFVYRNATNLASCNIDKLVYKGESIELNGIEFNNVNKIMVTKDVKHIGGNVSDFKYDIHVNNISDWLSIDLSYPIFDEDTKLYVDGDLAEVVITPEDTTRIGDYNLHGASFIKTLILNEWVEYLGEYSIDCENVEELYYYIVDATVHTYSNIRVKNLKKLILGENIKNTPKIEFDSTIDEVHIHENVESINLRGHIKDLYVNSNTLDVTDYLSRIDYDNLYIGENVESINPSNFKRDIYNIEYTNDEYSIIVLNDNAVFSTNELVSDIGGTITITAPAQMLKQFGASVVYNDVTVTGSGDAKVIGVFKNKITIGSDITSIQVKDDYMTNHDYKYTLEVLGDSIEFVDKFDRCSNLSFANLTALFKSNFESGNPLTDGASLIYNKEEVRSLTVPSGITYLPDKIFEKYRIDSIDLNEIEIIGVNSFAWANIGNIIINEGLKEIKDNAFTNSNIEELLFPSTLEKIGYGAFSQTPIKEFIPKSAIEIGSYAFSNCKELKTVNFNTYPQNLGNNSFYNCGIEYLTISSGSTGEVVSAFDGCYNIKEYDVPTLEGYTSQTILKSEVSFKLTIRSGSFWPITNSNLKELVLGSEVEVSTTNNIQCDGLLKLTIEEGATVSTNFIDETKCHKLVEVVNLTDTELELSSDVVVKTSDDVSNFEVVNDLVLYSNEGLVYIVDYLGSNSKVDLTELNLNREYIVRKYCFGYCSADEHPSSYNIEEISIGDNITRLEDFALGYNNISEVHLPYSLEYISPSAFAFNPLTYISIDAENPNYFIENGNIITNDSNTILIGTNGVISNNIEGIADYAFSGRLITQVNIPNSVTSIGYKAFERSYYIEEFIYNASISEGDFNPIKISYYETPLTTVIIGENTNVLPNYFMANSSGIKEVIFNCTNPTVGNEAFNNCSNLAKVTFNYEFKNIGQRMFKSCSKLATVNAENEFNTIGYQAFSDCISLEDITPLLDVNYIYDYAFSNCGIYSNIKLDFTNIQYIAKGAFSSFRPTVDELIIDSIVDKGFNSSSAPITKLTDIFGTYGTPIYKIIYTGTTVTENAPILKSEVSIFWPFNVSISSGK